MDTFDSFPNGTPVDRTPPSEEDGGKRPVSAGFGSPGSDPTVRRINLNDALITHPQATFLMRASGSSMQASGITDGDVLLVDRALQPVHGSIVVAVVDGELLCRRYWRQGAASGLGVDAGGAGGDLSRPDGEAPEIWGVVTTAIRSLLA